MKQNRERSFPGQVRQDAGATISQHFPFWGFQSCRKGFGFVHLLPALSNSCMRDGPTEQPLRSCGARAFAEGEVLRRKLGRLGLVSILLGLAGKTSGLR